MILNFENKKNLWQYTQELHIHGFPQPGWKHGSCPQLRQPLPNRSLKAWHWIPVQQKVHYRRTSKTGSTNASALQTYRNQKNVWTFKISIDNLVLSIMQKGEASGSPNSNLEYEKMQQGIRRKWRGSCWTQSGPYTHLEQAWAIWHTLHYIPLKTIILCIAYITCNVFQEILYSISLSIS